MLVPSISVPDKDLGSGILTRSQQPDWTKQRLCPDARPAPAFPSLFLELDGGITSQKRMSDRTNRVKLSVACRFCVPSFVARMGEPTHTTFDLELP